MNSTTASRIDNIFNIIAGEVRVPMTDLTGDTEFADLGVDDLLAESIVSKVAEEMTLELPAATFNMYPTADSLQAHLGRVFDSKPVTTVREKAKPTPLVTGVSGPLSMVLQGWIGSSKRILFLLPDGSGSGMAYAMLPTVDPDICVVALNSPYIRCSKEQTFSVQGIAAIWADEIRRRQPQGPYLLGGWSAGGYYSYEVAKILHNNGQRVTKLILIDSPCRLVYGELPMEVVHYLSTHNLMGNWGSKQPPAWMVNHFDMSIRAIADYVPTPMESSTLPNVYIIWARDGVFKETSSAQSQLSYDDKVTRMLMERPDTDGPLGWDMLFPAIPLKVAQMPGNHFTIVFPPHVSVCPVGSLPAGLEADHPMLQCSSLSVLLRDAVCGQNAGKKAYWHQYQA